MINANWIIIIFPLVLAILGVINLYLKRQLSRGKRAAWILEIIIFSLTSSYGFYRQFIEKKPEFVTRCEFDELKEKINNVQTDNRRSPDEQGDITEISNCLSKICKNAIDSGLVAIGLEKYPEAIIHLTYAAEASKEIFKKAECYFYLGAAYHDWGLRLAAQNNSYDAKEKYIRAISFNDKSILLYPQNPTSWSNRAASMLNLARNEEAIASCDSCIRLERNNAHGWNIKSIALFHLGKFHEAVACADSAIKYEPQNAGFWNDRAMVLEGINSYENALACFNNALTLNSKCAFFWNNRGNALRHLRRYSEAIANYDSAIFYEHNNAPFWNNRALAFYDSGLYAGAVLSCDSSLKYDHKYWGAWSNKGLALGKLDNYRGELACYDSAIIYKPDCVEAWSNRGAALYYQKEYTEAIKSCKIALSLISSHGDAWNIMAISLIGLDKKKDALACFDSGLVYCPNNKDLKDNRIKLLNSIK